MMVLVELPVLTILLVLWAGIGFAYWVPLLVRMIAYYILSVLRVALGATESLDDAMEALGFAVDFYGKGFRMILGVFDSSTNKITAFGNDFGSGGRLESWLKMFGQTAWTVVFWAAILVVALLFVY